MELATGALGPVIKKLAKLLKDEYNLQNSVKNNIQFMKKELEATQVALGVVGDVPPEQLSNPVKLWASEVRELSYDMEDILDTFLVRVKGPAPVNKKSIKRFLKRMKQIVTRSGTCHDIAQEINDIMKRVEDIADRRKRYNVDSITPATLNNHDDPRTSFYHPKEIDLVGTNKAIEELITRLQQHRIVSIVGFGGLGKTALAKAVCARLNKNEKFDCTGFVPLSRSPNKKEVLRNILYELQPREDREEFDVNKLKELNEHQLTTRVQEFLEMKRYLIVIDDVWEEQSWCAIKTVLVDSGCGSRVMITTRNFDVATIADEIYRLQPLSYENSKTLFHETIFGKGKYHAQTLDDEVSDKFLRKCDGVPLAIITMASLLRGKPTEKWSNLYTTIGFGNKDNMESEDAVRVNNTKIILSFSYYDMPSYLRPCLLYLSAFPEDCVVRKDPLIWKWIAEGFVYNEDGKELFKLGQQYFNDLIKRNMIQAVETEDDGVYVVDGCRVHDMILDLIRSLSCEKKFLTILDNDAGTSLQDNVRRLAFQKITAEHVTRLSDHMGMSKVRSYIACMCIINQSFPLLSFKVLRVLAIEDCQFREHFGIEIVGNLLQLRYFSLRNTTVREIPKNIANLKFLQTLDLDDTGIEELPASIFQLTQLMCLSCDGWRGLKRVPNGIGRLTSLEQLTLHFDHGYHDATAFVKELCCLTELRVLKIYPFFVCGGVDDMAESLHSLHKIQHIKLAAGYYQKTQADIDKWEAITGFVLPSHLRHLCLSSICFSRLPSCIDLSRLDNLFYLKLRVGTISQHQLKHLGKMMQLRYLELIGTEATITVSNINATDGFFKKLMWFNMPGVMVQVEHKEDSSFSFHIWNGIDPVPFASRRSSPTVRSAVMPELQFLGTSVFLRALKDANGDYSYTNIGFECLPSLDKVQVYFRCNGVSAKEAREAKSALMDVLKYHPKRPTFEDERWGHDKMIPSQEDGEDDDSGEEEDLSPLAKLLSLRLINGSEIEHS